MDRVDALRQAARHSEFYAGSREAIGDLVGAERARAIRTELLNMADEIACASGTAKVGTTGGRAKGN